MINEIDVKPKQTCEDCGIEINANVYDSLCNSCRETRYYNKCIKMIIKEYEKKYPDYMIIFDGDYYNSIENVLEYYNLAEKEILQYMLGTEKIYFDGINHDEKYGTVMYVETDIVIDIPESVRNKHTTKAVESKKNIKELFANFEGEYCEKEVDWGKPVGNEIW